MHPLWVARGGRLTMSTQRSGRKTGRESRERGGQLERSYRAWQGVDARMYLLPPQTLTVVAYNRRQNVIQDDDGWQLMPNV